MMDDWVKNAEAAYRRAIELNPKLSQLVGKTRW